MNTDMQDDLARIRRQSGMGILQIELDLRFTDIAVDEYAGGFRRLERQVLDVNLLQGNTPRALCGAAAVAALVRVAHRGVLLMAVIMARIPVRAAIIVG